MALQKLGFQPDEVANMTDCEANAYLELYSSIVAKGEAKKVVYQVKKPAGPPARK